MPFDEAAFTRKATELVAQGDRVPVQRAWERVDAVHYVDGVPVARPQWGDVRVARFHPPRVDNLRPEALPFVGEVIEVEFGGTMDDGPYEGQPIWMPVDRSLRLGWIPDEDLADTI